MWIQTFTGKSIDLSDPEPEQIDLRDIAHALANTGRFGGHTRVFYSVAEHSIRCSEIVPQTLKLTALFHDAAKAYIGDVVAPLKLTLPALIDAERQINKKLALRFEGLIFPFPQEVREADAILLATERRDLLSRCSSDWQATVTRPLMERILEPLDPHGAYTAFFNKALKLLAQHQTL